MTIIAWAITEDWAVVAADRRVTTYRGSTIVSAEDTAMKTFILSGQLLMAYTGLAMFGSKPTEEWVADKLQNVHPNDIPGTLARSLDEYYARHREVQGYPHHFRGLGFAYQPARVPARFPIGFEVSNSSWIAAGSKVVAGTVRENFSARWNALGNHKAVVGAVGAPYSLRSLKELEKRVKQLARSNPRNPSLVFADMAKFCAGVAAENPIGVGKHLLISSLPKVAVPASMEIGIALTEEGIAPTSISGPMALMVDPDGTNPITYLPVMIWPDIQMMGGQVGPSDAVDA